MNMETEIGVVWPEAKEAKECIQLPEAGRGEEGSSARASGGVCMVLPIPWFLTFSSETVRK